MMFEDFELISVYSRAQAIEDGLLVDVSKMAKEAGIRFPVAVTQAVWAEIVPTEEDEKAHGQSINGRLWDILWLLRCEAVRTHGSSVAYPVFMVQNGAYQTLNVKGLVHPGDDSEPVITLMRADED